ncbi:unnamed protein product (mitochondrion) [Plasmodiophora brassicae]|uniref:RecF/RecN/SMC N-terminal domain-containing protein n=1 Tax=Plasmodiophora brassicae TaxID=37360 RepID=A0A3P3Y2C0_PLABS|nr:unnamed protein product [Plasmodiophora brassicae]
MRGSKDDDRDEDVEMDDVDEADEVDGDDGIEDPNSERNRRIRSQYAQSGVIRRIKLLNFMCHDNLEVNLSPHVNFIHGENGSGKSAILIAICACLGVKASDTNRGSSLKDLIKHGKDWSRIELTIMNEGPDAYFPDAYGDSITVVREFTRASSTSTYKIVSSSGAIMGRSKKDLQGVLDHFNIQVENPCVVMNQDTSRDFLQSNKNEAKYEFFLRATQLKQMGETIADIEREEAAARQHLKSASEVLESLEQDYHEKEQLWKDRTSIQTIDQMVRELENECMWARCHHLQQELSTKEQLINEFETAVEAETVKLQDLLERKTAAVEKQRKAKAFLDEEKAKAIADTQRRNRLQADLQAAKKLVMKYQQQLDQCRKNKAAALKRKAQFQKSLQKLISEENTDREHEESLKAKKLERVQSEQDDVRARMADVKQRLSEASRNADALQDAYKGAEARSKDCRRRVQDLESQKRSMERAAANHLNAFGQRMTELVAVIDKHASRFRAPVIGPIGAHVTVLNERHVVAVQSAMTTKLLCGFLVDSDTDQQQLMAIFKNFFGRQRFPFIVVMKRSTQKYAIPRESPYGNVPTVLESVEIDDPWVFNALVDRARIENSLLLDSADAAMSKLRNLERSQRRGALPRIYLPDGDVVIGNNGAITVSPGPPRVQKMLGRTTSQDIEAVSRELNDAQSEAESLAAIADRARSSSNTAVDESRQLRMQEQTLQSRLDQLKTEISDLLRPSQAYDGQDNDALTELQSRIDQCDQAVADCDADEGVKQQLLDSALEDREDKIAAVTKYNSEACDAGAQLEQAAADLKTALDDIAELQIKLDKVQLILNKQKEKVADVENTASSMRSRLQEWRARAEAEGPEIQTDRHYEDITKEIAQLQKKQRDQEARFDCTLEETVRRYTVAKQKYMDAQVRIEEGQSNVRRIYRKRVSSVKDWTTFKKRIAGQTNANFLFNMSQKGHTGVIKFDHDKSTLHMHVKMANNQGEAEMTTDTKALSGGERSFTTLAFVVAIGESIRTPFRALDEFDIFMDNINRKIAINLLLELSKKYKNRQLILITPQDVSMVKATRTTYVLHLRPPAREHH